PYAWSCDCGAWRRAAPLVLLYYGFSIGVTFYNKWLMKIFPSPLVETLLHFLLIFGLSALVRALARCRSGRLRAALSWADCLRRAAPAALSISLDIGLSNWIQTASFDDDFVFALIQRVALLLVVLLVAEGLFMFTCKSTQFNTQGFMLVLCTSFIGDICWTLMQILMQKAELGLQNPIDIILHLQPLMFLGLFPLFVVSEGLPLSISKTLFHFHEAGMLFYLVGKLFLGGILAFGPGFSEFLVVSRASSPTLSIAGIFKEICILFLTTRLLGDRLSPLNWLDFAVCLSGISFHVILKAMNSKGNSLHKESSSAPDLELLLRPTEHGEEEEEDLEAPQQHLTEHEAQNLLLCSYQT
uniref:Solute carrier family 35 member C2 n=1 Tax=Amazona collaria TaxID=241587 RepID=A0A8B9FR96_9PSIT